MWSVDPTLLAGGMKTTIPQFASAIETTQGMPILDVVSPLAMLALFKIESTNYINSEIELFRSYNPSVWSGI